MTIAVIGTGIIGRKMAEALVRAGHDVIAYNRTATKAGALAESGVRVVPTPDEAVSGAEGVILTLSDKKAIDEVLTRITMTWKHKTCLQMGTISPSESIAVAQRIAAGGGAYAECPILGSRREIEQKSLILLFGGDRDLYTRWSDMLSAFGPAPRYVGVVGQAAALKLALNNLIAVHAAGFALSLGIVERNGLDREMFMEVLRESALYAPMYDKKLPNWTGRTFADPNFPAKHLHKDVELIAAHAREVGLETAVLDSIRGLLDQTIAKGWGDLDYSALINVIHPENHDQS